MGGNLLEKKNNGEIVFLEDFVFSSFLNTQQTHIWQMGAKRKGGFRGEKVQLG